jgi:hypothetical protein
MSIIYSIVLIVVTLDEPFLEGRFCIDFPVVSGHDSRHYEQKTLYKYVVGIIRGLHR